MSLFKPIEFAEALNDKMFSEMKRRKRKIGLREFAKESGVSSSTLSRVAKANTPDIETFLLLCKWMNMKPDIFFKTK